MRNRKLVEMRLVHVDRAIADGKVKPSVSDLDRLIGSAAAPKIVHDAKKGICCGRRRGRCSHQAQFPQRPGDINTSRHEKTHDAGFQFGIMRSSTERVT